MADGSNGLLSARDARPDRRQGAGCGHPGAALGSGSSRAVCACLGAPWNDGIVGLGRGVDHGVRGWQTLAKEAAVGVLVVASIGCNDGAPTVARNTAEVTIRYDADGDGGRPARTARLRCPSTEHRKACERLTSLPSAAFRPVPSRTFCTQIYGGPEAGSIQGMIAGRGVSARYNRRNGCEIARLSRVAPILDVARTSGRDTGWAARGDARRIASPGEACADPSRDRAGDFEAQLRSILRTRSCTRSVGSENAAPMGAIAVPSRRHAGRRVVVVGEADVRD